MDEKFVVTEQPKNALETLIICNHRLIEIDGTLGMIKRAMVKLITRVGRY